MAEELRKHCIGGYQSTEVNIDYDIKRMKKARLSFDR